MSNNKKIKVIFIGGYGRSGSTLLDRMLGQFDGFFSVGELKHIWDRAFAQNQLCGCGEPFRDCALWRMVVEEAFGGFDRVDVEYIRSLRNSVERLRYVPLLAWPTIRPPRFRSNLSEYLEILNRIYRAIHTVTGASLIVDSSKEPSHGFVLSEVPDLQLHTIHLVRDSRAVAYSWQRKKQRPEIHWGEEYMPRYSPLKSAWEWDLMNGLIELLGRRAPYVRVRYEELVSRPRETLLHLTEQLGFGYVSLDFIQGFSLDLTINHTVAGNPIRFQRGRIEVRPDAEWGEKMSWGHKLLVAALTWPMLRKYGYLDNNSN